jgi:hypothetical protein
MSYAQAQRPLLNFHRGANFHSSTLTQASRTINITELTASEPTAPTSVPSVKEILRCGIDMEPARQFAPLIH